MTRLSIRSLGVEYGRGTGSTRPFSDLSMDVDSGELVLLMGPSGCGKTTLVSCLAGVLTPARGTIRLGDVEVTALRGAALARYRRRTCGVVFQSFNLIQSLSALENIAVPLQNAGATWSNARAEAVLLLSDVGLADQAIRLPGQLSGGQQQRVAIARALGGNPPLLLADEPTAHLDDEQAYAIARILRDLARPGRIVIVATHDDRLVASADRVVRLGSGTASPPAPRPAAPMPPPSAPVPPAPGSALLLPPAPLGPSAVRRPMPPELEIVRPRPAAIPRPVLTAFAPPPPQPVRSTPATPPPPPRARLEPGPAPEAPRPAAATKPESRRRRCAPRVAMALGAAGALVAGFALLRPTGAPGGSPAPAVASNTTPSTPSPTASAAPATTAGAATPAPTAPPTSRPRVQPSPRAAAPAPRPVTSVASAAPVPATAVPAAPVAAVSPATVTHTFSVFTSYTAQGSVSWVDSAVRPMHVTVTPEATLCAFVGGRVTALDLYQGSSLIAHFTPAPGCGAQTTPAYTPSTAAPATYTLVATTSMVGMTVTLQVTEGS